MEVFLLISCVTYYYFGDEIKVYSISLWHWLRGRGPDDGNNNINPNPTNRMNTLSNLFGLNKNNKESILAQIVEADATDAIEVVNEAAKGKDVVKTSLTSPSLDDLNNTVQESWSNSRPNSPESVTSSTGTIKPDNIPKIKIDTNISSSSRLPPSNLTLPKTPEGYIDEALTPNEINFKPFVTVELINDNFQYVYNESNWKSFLNKGVSDRMNWIESAIAYGNINDLDQESLNKLQGKATEIAIAYNSFAESFEKNRDKFDNDTAQPLKYFGF